MLDLGFRDENHKQKDKNLNYQIKRVFDLAVSQVTCKSFVLKTPSKGSALLHPVVR